MACEYINPLHVRNAIENRQSVFLPDEVFDDPQQGMIDRIKSVNNLIRLTSDQKNYMILGNPDKLLERSTTVVKRNLKEKDLGNNDDTVQSRGGTYIHLLLEFLVEKRFNPESMTQDRLNYYSEQLKKYKFDYSKVVDSLDKFLDRELLPRIYATQRKIDPNGKFKILTEQAVLDPVTGVVSRTDLVVVFSDGSVGKVDYKNTTARPEYTDSKTGRIISSGFMMAKRNYYREQATLNRNILKERYNANVVLDLVVPLHVKYESETVNGKNVLKEQFEFIESNADYSKTEGKFLNPLVIGKQFTGDAKLDAFIIQQTELLQKLLKKLQSNLLSTEQRQKYNLKVARIENIISELTTSSEEQDLKRVFEYANDLLKEYELNKGSFTADRLVEMYNEISVLLEIPEATTQFIEDYYKTPEDKASITAQLGVFTNKLNALLNNIQRDQLEYVTTKLIDQYYLNSDGSIKEYLEDTFMNSATNTAREFNSPFIVALKQGFDLAVQNPVNNKMKQIQKRILELNEGLNRAGISNDRLKQLLINPKTKNLFAKLAPEFYEKINEAFKTRSKASYDFILKHYEITSEHLEMLKQQKETIMAKYQAAIDAETTPNGKREVEKARDKFIKDNYLLDADGEINAPALFYPGNRKFITLKQFSIENNLSKEYREIKKTPAAAAWYDFYIDLNQDVRNMIGYSEGEAIPSNFFPWVRKTTLERLQEQGVFKGTKNSVTQFFESLNYRADDVHMGIKDEEFGKQIPFYFNTPFYSNDEVDDSDRSYDFGMTALLYAQMAYTYKHTRDYESDAMLLKQVMMNQANRFVIPVSTTGKPKLDVFGDIAYTPTMPASFEAQAFNDFFDNFIYGITVNEKDNIKQTIAGKEVNLTQVALKAKDITTRLQLSFSIIGAAASYANARLNLKLQSKKSIYFTPEMTKKSESLLTGVTKDPEKKKALLAAIEFFLPHTETFVEANLYNVSSRGKLAQNVNDRLAFYGYRKGSDIIDDVLTGNVLQNYGWDTDTKRIVRLNKPGLQKQYTPLLDLITFDGEDIKFKDIPEEQLNKLQVDIRSAIKEISRGIKGEMSADDIAWYQQRLLGKLISQYRTWMPGILKERFGKLKYKSATDSVQWGRWRSLLADTNLEAVKELGVLFYAKDVLLPRIGKVALDVASMGLLSTDVKGTTKKGSLNFFSRYNDEFLKKQYDRIMEKNPHLDKISFEEFKEIKVAQYRAAMVELRMLLGLMAIIMFAGAHADDDDEFSYKENKAVRIALKTIAKLQQEMMFSVDPTEGGYLFQNPIPVLGMIRKAKNVFENGIDETRDLIFGEDSPRDKTPFLYYSSGFLQGMTQLRKVFEVFDQDKAISGYKR
jgi:hypothetical protein